MAHSGKHSGQEIAASTASEAGAAHAPGTASLAVRVAIACLASGAIVWLAFAPAGVWPLAFVASAPLLWAALALERTRGWGRLALYAVAWVACGLKWWALNAWLEQVTMAGLPMLSLYGAGFDVLSLWLLVRGRAALGNACSSAVLLPLAVVGAECLRSLVLFDGYPWFRAGHPLAEAPVLIQACDLGGEVVASLVAVCVAGAAADALLRVQGAMRARVQVQGAVVAVTVLIAAFTYGAFRLGHAPQGAGPGVLAIQTNLATSNKVAWAPQQQLRDVASFAELTLQAGIAATRKGDVFALVVWPETTLGGYGLEPAELNMLEQGGYFPGTRFQRLASRLSDQLGVPLLVGSPCYIGMRESGDRWVWDKQFNSAYMVNAGPPPYPRYDKLFLAPFGETMPYIRAWPELQARLLAIGARGMQFDLHAGTKPVRFDVPWKQPDGQQAVVRVAVPICFEDAMSWVCRDLVFEQTASGPVRRADLLVNITNDGWFGWFDGGRAQHVQLARFRCVETRTPMVRVANTGMCAGIDSSGRMVADPPAPQKPGWLFADPPLDERMPVFARIGDSVSWAVMGMCALISIFSFVRPAARDGSTAMVGRGALPGASRGAALARGASTALGLAAVLGGATMTGGCAAKPRNSDDPQAQAQAQAQAQVEAQSQARAKAHAQDQPWSSREQSTIPTGQAKMSEGSMTNAPPIQVASSGSAHRTAATLLQEASHSPVPVFRANAVEALSVSPDDLKPIARRMLADPNRGVRFVAAMSVGRINAAEFADAVQPLLVDESASVRAAAIYALTRFGQSVDQTPLAAMAMSDDPEVRSNAYMVLGELGNPTALPVIKTSLGKGLRIVNPARVRIIELQAAEAMVRLGDLNQLEPIRAALFAPSDQNELTALASQIAGRLKDGGCRPMLIRLIDATGESARPAEIRLTAAASLAELGPQDSGQIARLATAYVRDRDPIVRGQAALALARAQGLQAVPELEKMLFDVDPLVQLATAKAVLIATRPR